MDRKALPPKADCSLPGLLSSFHCKQIKKTCCCCLVAKSCPTLQPHGLQNARLLCPPLSHGVCSNSCPLSRWCYLTISSSAALLLLPSIFLSIRVFFQWVGSLHQMATVLELQLQHQFFQWIFRSGLISFRIDWLDLLAVQGTLKSSPEPQFKSISSLALSFLYGSTLTSVYDYCQ